MKNWTRTYYLFIGSKRTYNLIKHTLQMDYVWSDLWGAGYAATVELSAQQLRDLQVKLWGGKYHLFKVRGE